MTPMQADFKAFPHRRILVSLLVATALLADAPGHAEIRNHAILGYDSFIDRFTILEADTFESTQELFFGLGNALQYRSGTTKAGLSSLLRVGNQTMNEHLEAEGSVTPSKSTVLDLRTSLYWRHFQEGSDYEFGNDYTQGNAVLRVRADITATSRMSFRSRLEAVDYREKTDFDYDYRYYDGGVEFQAGELIDRFFLIGIAAGAREAPDTTALGYDRLLGELEARLGLKSTSMHIMSAADRREYRGSVRSSSWNSMSSVELTVNMANGYSISVRGESELMLFDRPDTTYFDTKFLRALVHARIPLSSASSAFIEPRFGRMLCNDFEEERYTELSCVIGADMMKNDGLWVSLSYEPGYRDYALDGNELYSDFLMHRFSAMGTLSMPHRLALNLFVTHEPERHSRREDDFSITLISIDLTRRF